MDEPVDEDKVSGTLKMGMFAAQGFSADYTNDKI